MKTARNIVLAIAAGSALALGIAAHAQEAKKPEALSEHREQRVQDMRGMHEHGMQGMRQMRGRCHEHS